MEIFDLGIIGGGPAGYTSALYAANKGKKVVLFESNELGGTCLNKGCIPTKLFLHAAEVYQEMLDASKIGLFADNISFDFSKISEHKDKTVLKLRKSLELMLKNAGITVIKSEAVVAQENIIKSENVEYKCTEIIMATGSKPKELKGLEFDHEFILNSDDILEMKELPNKIIIVGSGAIGVEWTRILSTFGVEVVIIELASRLVPLADWEISKRIERQFKIKKIKYYLDTTISNVENKCVTLSNGEKIETDKILVAAGRVVNNTTCLSDNKISVIGDAAEIQLAHYAVSQAKECILDISFDKELIPSVIYGTPEISWVGKTFNSEEEEQGYNKVVFPVSALGKAHCDGCIDGFIKLVAKDNKIVGAHIVSKEASALIQQVVIAMQNGITIDKLKQVCFAHPTYSEGLMEGIMQL